MKITYSNNMADVAAFCRHEWLHHSSRHGWWRTCRLLLLYSVASYFLAVLVQSLAALFVIMPVGLIYFVIIEPSLRLRRYVNHACRLHATDGWEGILGIHELELTETAIIERHAHGVEMTDLSGVNKVESTESHTFVYVGLSRAHVIPRKDVAECDYLCFVEALKDSWLKCHHAASE